MSASDIENLDTSVSTDDTDLTKLSAEELLAVVAELRQENKTLLKSKNKVGLTFKRIPEDGNESLIRLENGEFPYLTKNESLSIMKEEKTDGNIALIEGENLAVLTALQMTHKNKVDVIYIDPPYNTGNDDFIYEDKRMYKSDAADLEGLEGDLDGKARTVGKDDPFRHSKWLSFMERRLFLAKELLSEDGVIFVSIDDNEQARLKLLMDSVFGNGNFIALLPVINNYKGNNDQVGFAGTHEYCIVFAKNYAMKPLSGIPISASQISEYSLEDEIGKYKQGAHLVATGANAPRAKRPNLFYSIYVSSDLRTVSPHRISEADIEILPLDAKKNEMSWRWSKEKLFTSSSELIIKRQKGGKIDIFKKQRLEGDAYRIKPKSLFMKPEYSGTSASTTVKAILPENSFSYPKSIALIKDLIVMHSKKDAFILDFFAGSGTTGHAVAELNKEDGGTRSTILVTNNESGIARNVTRERIARVLTGKNWADGKEHTPLPGNLSFYEMDFMKLPANPLTVAQMMEKKFDGILSLENNTLNLVEEDVNEDFAIYDNTDMVTLVWKNFFSLYDGDFEDTLDSIKVKFPSKRLVAYVPSELEDTDMEAEGWEIISFPHDYINRYNAMIATMRRNQTLPNAK